MRVKSWISFALSLACSLASAQTSAADEAASEPSSDKLKLSGFGTLGYWSMSGPQGLKFRREVGQNLGPIQAEHVRADSRLGAQLNYQLLPSTELVTQVVLREQAGFRAENTLEWAFAKFQPHDDVELRLGRIGMSTFMLSDYRNVGYAYNWVRPPQEFYGWIPFYSFDGGDAVYTTRLGDGHLKTKAFLGNTEASMPWWSESYRLKAKGTGLGLSWDNDEWQLRAHHTRLKFTVPGRFGDLITALNTQTVWPQGYEYASEMNLSGATLDYSMIGATWSKDNWQVSGEIASTRASSFFAPQGTSAYLTVGRRINQWVPFVSYARNWDKRKLNLPYDAADPLNGYKDLVRSTFAATSPKQYTFSVGTRWDLATNVALKLQWDRTVIPETGLQLWDVPANWHGGSARIVSATLDFIF